MKKLTFSLHSPLQFGHFQTPIILKTHFENSFGDLDNLNQVEASNSQCVAGSPEDPSTNCKCAQCVNEYNPVYNDAYDALGTRFRSANTFLWGVNVKLIGKF